MKNLLTKAFKIPIFRHLLAALIIVVSLMLFVIVPLENANKRLSKEIININKKQHQLIKILSEKETFKIENKIDGVKIKKGGTIKLIPDNDIKVKSETLKKPPSKNINFNKEKAIEDKKWWKFWTSINTIHNKKYNLILSLKQIDQTRLKYITKLTNLGFVWHRDWHFLCKTNNCF